jgi:hypothetical protein
MRLTKQQQETYDDLMAILKTYGKPYLLGWLLGLVIQEATHDPNLRRKIKNKTNQH